MWKSAAAVLVVTLLAAGVAWAGDFTPSGKLLLTDGVSAIEGEAGGGLSAWAVIAGGETLDGVGVRAHATYVSLPDFSLETAGLSVGLFDTEDAGAALGLGRGFSFDQDVVGAKLRLFGDAVYDQDRWWPQVSAGVQYKSNDQGPVVHAVGARRDQGVDAYLAATKLLLGQSLLISGAVRATEANQFGTLGFGGDRHDGYSAEVEGAASYLLSRRFVVGVEGRTKPDNLAFAREDDAYDVFAAYAFNKTVSLTVAYVDLGSIATFSGQRGAYVSLQAGF